jgi:hypothetical protein
MPDYRTMFDQAYVGAWDLVNGEGRHVDVTVTISRVEAQKVKGPRGESLKPVVFFEGRDRGLLCNKTNAKAIANMYGRKTEAWVGKRVTMYATTTNSPDGEVECIRIRPTPPPDEPRANGGRGKGTQTRMPGEEG